MIGSPPPPADADDTRSERRAAILLCGGKSSRMGRPKAWLPFHGEPLLTRIGKRVSSVVSQVVIVAAPDQALPSMPNAHVLRDPETGRGPLMGLRVGLAALSSDIDAVFVTATDAPFLSPALIERLFALRRPEVGPPFDIVVPKAHGHHQPLCAVYVPSVFRSIDRLLAEDRLRPFFLLQMHHHLIAEAELLLADPVLAREDPNLSSLRNLNTPEDYAAALREADVPVT